MQWSIRAFIDTENGMTSVERLLEFSIIPSEAPYKLPSDSTLTSTTSSLNRYKDLNASEAGSNTLNGTSMMVNDTNENKYTPVRPSELSEKLPEDILDNDNHWPLHGEIKISNLKLKYRPELEYILKGISLTIPARAKVGICGRTGSGKSSLMLALFRLVEYETDSSISIDGVDIREVGLYTLRSQLTIIPQDPVMFCGTLRYNLDPFTLYTDQEIWNVLERVQLKTVIQEKFPLLLSTVISERGENISVGQRQLLCIARALLRKSKIIILDEVRIYVYVYACMQRENVCIYVCICLYIYIYMYVCSERMLMSYYNIMYLS